MSDHKLDIDRDKVNSTMVKLLWIVMGVGAFTYFVSMLSQKKEILYILKNIGIFVSIYTLANLISTITFFVFKKFRIFVRYFVTTTFIMIMPLFTYVSFETNHETWVLAFPLLIIIVLQLDIGLIIYSTIMVIIINGILLYLNKEVLIKEFYNPTSEIVIRIFALILFSSISIYIVRMINKMLKSSKIHEDILAEEKEGAIKTLSAVRDLSDSLKGLQDKNNLISKRLLTASESQASSVEQIAASTEELMSSIEEISKTAVQASSEMENIVNDLQGGMTALKGSTEEMMALVKFSKIMLESIEAINEIAENTNLLALNAAIEAARAGEAGKGFAVVATEIRKLAEKSTTAAQNVGNLLKESETKIKNGSALNTKVNQIFSNISKKLETISKVFQQISFATQELDKGGKEISGGLEVINQASTENLELSKDIEIVNIQFDKETKKLNQIIKTNRKLGLDLVKKA
ncbi:MAG: hypothetical protein A2086_11890 [Spirochaetes bacterium GWD1_27_9]|nr:MAG: hypothetical protein A2Z98_11490 [Spirochaetes bacterium GWB1_27_13]OHD27463.1 MAG: hypothetical protein A2Y34_16205 [Spirochaetes bacterium GWC1_27_15]OHD28659.1 MAG: hypothetical protein A2086_11890 [Spirochaetes bacterium GWD1_27_9]